MSKLIEQLAALLWDRKGGTLPKLSRKFFETYKDTFAEAVAKGWTDGGLSIDWTSPDALRLSVMEANVFRFSAAKSDTLLRTLMKAARELDNFNDFRKKAIEEGAKFNRRWLQTEYNFAVAVGQNGAKYQRQMSEKSAFPYVRYSTIADARVRDAHKILDGKIFEVGSAAYDTVNPPNGWGCRCEMNQIDEEERGTTRIVDERDVKRMLSTVKKGTTNEYDYMVKHGFDKNRGKIGEVFAESEFYTNLPTRTE